MSRLTFEGVNPLVSVQDAGRRGAMRYGVSESGPMDVARHRLARVLAGEAPGGPVIEVGLGGLTLRADGPVRLGIAGPGFVAETGERSAAAPVSLTLADGAALTLRPGQSGMWAYIAVAGADWGPALLGSHATNSRTGLGARDFSVPLNCEDAAPAEMIEWQDPVEDGAVALLPGPQHHLFGEDAHEALVAEAYQLTKDVDRMGYKLEGAKLVAPGGHDIISDGIVEGAMQVPGNGQPIVQMADRAPTGGYPKIAVVAAVDRPRLAQHRPGEEVRFAWTTREEALARRRALIAAIDAPERRRRTEFAPQFLAARNLVSGVWPQPE